MSVFDFVKLPDRRGSDSVKWGKYAGRDVLPLWVADMDFPAPPPVISAIQERVAHGVLGYPTPWPSLVESVLDHLKSRYGWQVESEWLVWLPGLVTGLNVACRSVEGGVLTAIPVYPPFLSAPVLSERAVVKVSLDVSQGRWGFDWDAMEQACTPETELLLLCHPHNPVGRCWEREELAQLADFAARHDLLICSDEIHCDLILDEGRQHIPLACLSPEVAARTVTLMAPSKTFNIPGLGCSFAIIPNAIHRRRFTRSMAGIVPHVNVLGLVACEAAYRQAGVWHEELLQVLRRNRDRVEAVVATLPGLAMNHVEATYLAWIDARSLGVSDPTAYFESHGLGLSDGAEFGAPRWVRLNFGCSPELLEVALDRLKIACAEKVS